MNKYAKLYLFHDEKCAQPFDPVSNNCCFFSCDWLSMACGFDPAADFRPRVDSALSMARVVKEEGGVEAIADRICAANNWAACDVKQAQRGDVVLRDSDHGPALGVCAGAESWFAGLDGIEKFKTLNCRGAWRIS